MRDRHLAVQARSAQLYGKYVSKTPSYFRRSGDAGGRELDLLLHRAAVVIREVDAEQAAAARAAFTRFGKGRHPAGLNFGDLFSYALAHVSGEPLLSLAMAAWNWAQKSLTDVICASVSVQMSLPPMSTVR